MSNRSGSNVLSLWGHVFDALQSGNARSIAEYTKDQRINPQVGLEASLVNAPFITDVLHTLNGIFSSYIMQAATRKLNVNSIETNRMLHSLSTDRSKVGSASVGFGTAASIAASMESFHNGLAWGGVEPDFSMEARDNPDEYKTTVGKKTGDDIRQPSNLGVGRILEVGVEANGNHASVIMTVQFMTQVANANAFERLLVTGVKPESAKQRYHRWRAGMLDGWKDVLNNIVVISRSTFEQVQNQTGNFANNMRKRDEIMAQAGCVFLAVVDPREENVVIYTHTIDGSTELSSRDIKAMGGKGGSDMDLMDIFRQFQSSTSPSVF